MTGLKINTTTTRHITYLFLGIALLISPLFVMVPTAGAATYCPKLGYVTDEATCAAAPERSATGGNATDLGGSDSLEGNTADKTSFSFGQCGKDQVGIECLVDEILTVLSALVGIAVVGGITAGGIMYSTSKGNPAGTQKGKTLIGNSVIGLVLYFLMFAIINFLVPGGVF